MKGLIGATTFLI